MIVEFDAGKLSLGDIEDLETYTGLTFEEIQNLIPTQNGNAKAAKAPPAKVTVAITWIVRRQSDPSFTVEQARNLTLEELVESVPNRAARRAKPKPKA